MGDRLLLRTNLLVGLILTAGLALISVFQYRADYEAAMQQVEQSSQIISESIYCQQQAFLTQSIAVSQAMASDSLLLGLLSDAAGSRDGAFDGQVASYLSCLKDTYGFGSVFLVATGTDGYYTPAGLDRTLAPADPEDSWYFDLLANDQQLRLNVDNDQAQGAGEGCTVFVNCKMLAEDGSVLGVVGVGLPIADLQQLLAGYQEGYGMQAALVQSDGTIVASPHYAEPEGAGLAEAVGLDGAALQTVLEWEGSDEPLGFWKGEDTGHPDYLVVRYLPEFGWHLVVERDASDIVSILHAQVIGSIILTVLIAAIVMALIAVIVSRFRRRVVCLTRELEGQRKTLFELATSELFEDIYELDVTHDCPADDATRQYFASLGLPAGALCGEALRCIANRQVKEGFRQGYLDMFLPENVKAAFERGQETLHYELMISNDGVSWRWMRITARLVENRDDKSIRLLSYRQDINDEKLQEFRLLRRAETDEMTGMLAKIAARRHVKAMLDGADWGSERFALFVVDIDNFKGANDQHGHRFGDKVIVSFSETLKEQFGQSAVLGRIGGDEFIAFVAIPSREWAVRKAEVLVRALERDVECAGGALWHQSASIGVAVAPADGIGFEDLYLNADLALYEAKRAGRCGFSVYGGVP